MQALNVRLRIGLLRCIFTYLNSRFIMGHNRVPLHNTRRGAHWQGAKQDCPPLAGSHLTPGYNPLTRENMEHAEHNSWHIVWIIAVLWQNTTPLTLFKGWEHLKLKSSAGSESIQRSWDSIAELNSSASELTMKPILSPSHSRPSSDTATGYQKYTIPKL